MTEKKLTEAEIMKALECCNAYNYDDCCECPLYYEADCAFPLAVNCLDLIDCKNAENERLTVTMNAFGLGMKRESERADSARAEAIKEVYTRLSMNFGTYTDDDSVKLVDLFRLFDQIAKEMGVEL